MDRPGLGQPRYDGTGRVLLPVEPRHLLGERGPERHRPYPHRQPLADEGEHADLEKLRDISMCQYMTNPCLQKYTDPHNDSEADVAQRQHNGLTASLLHTFGQNAKNLKNVGVSTTIRATLDITELGRGPQVR